MSAYKVNEKVTKRFIPEVKGFSLKKDYLYFVRGNKMNTMLTGKLFILLAIFRLLLHYL